MLKSCFTLVVIFLSFSLVASAKQLKRTVVAQDLISGSNTTLNGLPSAVVTQLINKANWGDESCKLRFFAYGSTGEDIRAIWLAAIFDTNTQSPAGWRTFNVNSSGQHFKVASYADTTKMKSDTRIGLDTVCWE